MMSMDEQNTAGPASTDAGLRGVRRARRLLFAILVPSVIVVASQTAAVGLTMLMIFTELEGLRNLPPEQNSGDFSLSSTGFQITFLEISLVAFPLSMLPFFIFNAAGMLSIFLTLHRGKPLASWTSHLMTISAALAALLMFFLVYNLDLSSGSVPGIFAIPLRLFAIAYIILCVGIGIYLLRARRKLLEHLSANGIYGELKRRRAIISGVAISAATAGGVTAAGTVALSIPGSFASVLISLSALSLPSLFLLLPVALIASDAYNMRRQRLEEGTDKRLAMAWGAILLAFSGMLVFALSSPQYLYPGPGFPHVAELELCGDEYVEIRNGGNEDLDLEDWVIRQGHYAFQRNSFEVPGATLARSERVRIYTQAPPADAPEGSLTFGRSSPLWHDSGDIARLAMRDEQDLHSLHSEQCTR